MKCGYCGQSLRKDAKYCTYCGHKINGTGIIDDGKKDGSYLASIVSLVIIIAVSIIGGIRIILPMLNSDKAISSSTVSTSDHAQIITTRSSKKAYTHTTTKSTSKAASTTVATKALSSFDIDNSVCGRWICTDKTQLGFSENDFGVRAEMILELGNGDFNISYTVVNTGITERKTKFSGTFSAANNSIVIKPNARTYDGTYFTSRGIKMLSLKYSIKDRVLTLSDSQNNTVKLIKNTQED